jgi:hypothetical protein
MLRPPWYRRTSIRAATRPWNRSRG